MELKRDPHGTRLSDYSPVIMEVLTPVTRYM